MLEIVRLQLRQILGGRRSVFAGFFLLAPVLLTLAIGLWGDLPRGARPDPRLVYLFMMYAEVVSILLALLYGASILGTELEGKTLTYLFTRPVGRWRVVLGKYLGILAVLVPSTLASLLLSWGILGGPGGARYLLAFTVSTLAATCAYNAIFAIFGVAFPRRSLVICLLYAGAFEFLVSFVPALVNTLTVHFHLRSLVVRMAGIALPSGATRVIGDAGLGASLAALAAMTGGALGIASVVACRKEFLISEQG